MSFVTFDQIYMIQNKDGQVDLNTYSDTKASCAIYGLQYSCGIKNAYRLSLKEALPILKRNGFHIVKFVREK